MGAPSQQRRSSRTTWVDLVGFYFFNQSWTYLEHDDLILTVMCALTLPLACLAAWWEQDADGQQAEAIVWARGTVAFAGGPYMLVTYVPYPASLPFGS